MQTTYNQAQEQAAVERLVAALEEQKRLRRTRERREKLRALVGK